MPFHTDYRPTQLKEFFGNPQAKKILVDIFKHTPPDKRPHSFLLIGPHGCGKTTLARIIAHLLGCSDTDFKELNAASFRGIDTAREVARNVNMKPLVSKVRVWFFDECHRLTKDAQEALLKVVESPPAHAYFIFSTTDPQELKPTLKDRCVVIPVKPLNTREAAQLIMYICKKEKKAVPPKEILKRLIKLAEGRPRAILMLLERVLHCESVDEMLQVLTTVGSAVEVQVKQLCKVILRPGSAWGEVAKVLLALRKEDPVQIRNILASYATSVLLSPNTQKEGEIAAIVLDALLNLPQFAGYNGIVLACFKAWVLANE